MGGAIVATSSFVVQVGLMLVAFYFLLVDGPQLVRWLVSGVVAAMVWLQLALPDLPQLAGYLGEQHRPIDLRFVWSALSHFFAGAPWSWNRRAAPQFPELARDICALAAGFQSRVRRARDERREHRHAALERPVADADEQGASGHGDRQLRARAHEQRRDGHRRGDDEGIALDRLEDRIGHFRNFPAVR